MHKEKLWFVDIIVIKMATREDWGGGGGRRRRLQIDKILNFINSNEINKFCNAFDSPHDILMISQFFLVNVTWTWHAFQSFEIWKSDERQ